MKKSKLVFLTLILSGIFFSLSVAAQTKNYWNSEGIRAMQYADNTDDDVLEITSASELGLLAYELEADTAKYAGKTIRLMADIDLSVHEGDPCYWAPMPASGINFDGNGKRIISMTIDEELNQENGPNCFIGFFPR